jgi:phosphatidylglycerophosphate synthase
VVAPRQLAASGPPWRHVALLSLTFQAIVTIITSWKSTVAIDQPMPPALRIDAGSWLASLGGVLLAGLLGLMRLGFGWHALASAMVGYGAIALLVMVGLAGHAPHRRFGAANLLTLIRATFVALLIGVIAEGGVLSDGGRWLLVAAGTAALALDGVDGWAARRSGLESPFGARFDMEVDALFVLTLATLAWQAGRAGAWVLLSGLMRYLYGAAGWLWPTLATPLPPSFRRKTICVLQIALLLAALAPAVGPSLAAALCLGGLLLLGYSFAADGVVQLGWSHGRSARNMPT